MSRTREVPGNNLSNDTDRLVGGVGDLVDARLNRRALDLISPAGVVLDRANRHGQVSLFRPTESLAVVQRFESGELILILLHQGGELVEEGTTGVTGCVVAPDGVEGFVCSSNGIVDILLGTF